MRDISSAAISALWQPYASLKASMEIPYDQTRTTVGRAALPLALALGLHLLLVLFWPAINRIHRSTDAGVGVETVVSLIWTTPSRQAMPEKKIEKRRIRPEPASSSNSNSPAIALPYQPSRQTPEPVPIDPLAASAAPSPAQEVVGADEFIARAKHDVGKIDRDLRKFSPPLSYERQDSPQLRLERGFAAAYVGHSHGVTLERYTSPDGVVITRMISSGDVKCYASGTVNSAPGILKDSARPQIVHCPASAGWTRY